MTPSTKASLQFFLSTPKEIFPNWFCSLSVAKLLLYLTFFPFMFRKMYCEITTSLPSVIWRNTLFWLRSYLGSAWRVRKDARGLDLLLAPGQPALAQVSDNIVLRRKANYLKLGLIHYHRGLNLRSKHLTLPRVCVLRWWLHNDALDNFKDFWFGPHHSPYTESGSQCQLCLISGSYTS